MTLADILSNERLRQEEFPVTAGKIFLAHAGVSPLPRRVAKAIQDYAASCLEQDQEQFIVSGLVRETRALAARLLEASPDEIAFVGPTSLGLSYVASGLAFEPGSNIVAYGDDYPSNVYPWMALASQGIEVRFVRPARLGVISAADLHPLLDRNTRLVSLASCHFISGARLDLETIGPLLRERRILFCLDAIQTLGAFPTRAGSVDFLAADAHKWLLGPCGAGILYVKKSHQEALRPPIYGWNNVRAPNYVAQETIVYRAGAQRYEAGTHNLLGLVGLRAAFQLLLEIGVENIARELLRKRAWFGPALTARGYEMAGAIEGELGSGIITVSRGEDDLRPVQEKLTEHQVISSLRFDRRGKHYLRFSPHFYNTDAELRRVLELV